MLFTLVDHPAVARGHPRRGCWMAPARALHTCTALPGPQGGHPIWFSRDLIAEFLSLPEDGAARDVVRAHAAETEFLDVDDAGVVADIDDPEEYRRLMGVAV